MRHRSATQASRAARVIAMLAALPFITACPRRARPDLEPTPEQMAIDSLPYDAMASRIITSLQPQAGEHVIVRYDPAVLADLAGRLQEKLAQAGAIVDLVDYGPIPDFESTLNRADAYLWLPTNIGPSPQQAQALSRWLASGPKRQIHFHWGAGTSASDGLPGVHAPVFDTIYIRALDIDYAALDRAQDAAIAKLRSGEVRVTTPAGTDLRFQLGDRPVTKQNGDASRARAARATVPIDKEIELPAGAIRVAPLETTVQGVLVVPSARIGGATVRALRLEFKDGVVVNGSADDNRTIMRDSLLAVRTLNFFREFALGFNPRLAPPAGSRGIPYYGYGAGVVRLSLGDNTELGGAVTGGGVRWFFFTDATVTVGGETIVEAGRLR